MHVHGFMGTGKRQYINYINEFISNDVIKLEYYCKEATVCDDILLNFNEIIEQKSISKAVNFNTKITTLNVKFQQQITAIKKPFLIILHSFDDVQEQNVKLIKDLLISIAKEENTKIIISTRAMQPFALNDLKEDRKIFLKAFTKEIFKAFLQENKINATENALDDFYKYTRGYYYYLALSTKIIQAMKTDLNEFLLKFNQSGLSFDSYLGMTYINLIPTSIRNFFWFLRIIRHGITLNALAIFEIYDEFSIEYLKANLMIFQVGEMLYVQDSFIQEIDIAIPNKIKIKLHKYIINIYEKQLKSTLNERAILISRQALRAEIEYHSQKISEIENGKIKKQLEPETNESVEPNKVTTSQNEQPTPISKQFEIAQNFINDKNYTNAIEAYKKILDTENIDLPTVVETRLNLAKLYKIINDNHMANHYYELVETYYKQHKEWINLNYLYYEMTDLYFKMYKHERAIETIKKVIYSVDTPQSLMVSACTLLGNIYSDTNNSEEAYSYYKKALDSLDENIESTVLADLYFKFALANDDKGEEKQAFEYYNKCITIKDNNPYKALAYSNLASCYYDNNNYNDAEDCFRKAYELEKTNNNFDGIYYNATHLAKILLQSNQEEAYTFLIEAKKSAEFINEEFYILESTIALGDYYYNESTTFKKALIEYFKALNLAQNLSKEIEISKIENRIKDMKLRMKPEDFTEIERKYENL